MTLLKHIPARQARPAVALLVVGCLVSFTLGQQLGFALRYPDLHASTIQTAHAAGKLSGRLSAPSSPSAPSVQHVRPVVTASPRSHTTALPRAHRDDAHHGKKDKHAGQNKQSGQRVTPAGHGGHDKQQKSSHGHSSDD